VFGTEAEAESYADEMLKSEWESNGPYDDDTGKKLPYPGDWRKANDAIAAGFTDGSWGEWQVTCHEIDIGDLAVVIDGGLVQAVVANGALADCPVTVIDYDTDGADKDELSEVDQGDDTVSDAFVSYRSISKAEIIIPTWLG
jgi:hypothetical protein